MKKKLRQWSSILIPFVIGVGIIYYQYTTLSADELQNINVSFKKANYNYIYLSLFIALIGYWSRAYRWKFALNHLGYSPKFHNNFFTVCVSYLVNLTVPRSGEVSRAALLKKYEEVPFDKGFGTIVAERIVDLFIFLLFVCVGLLLQYETIIAFLIAKKVSFETILLYFSFGIAMVILAILVWLYARWPIVLKIKDKLSGLVEGLTTVVKMKAKGYYLFHSFFIWFTYLTMFYVTIFALPETASMSFDVVVMGFIFGSLAVGFSNGGLGAYPFAIALVLSLYGIPNDIGTAFGWIIWTSQTLLAIFLGILSYLLLPIMNRK